MIAELGGHFTPVLVRRGSVVQQNIPALKNEGDPIVDEPSSTNSRHGCDRSGVFQSTLPSQGREAKSCQQVNITFSPSYFVLLFLSFSLPSPFLPSCFFFFIVAGWNAPSSC